MNYFIIAGSAIANGNLLISSFIGILLLGCLVWAIWDHFTHWDIGDDRSVSHAKALLKRDRQLARIQRRRSKLNIR